MKFYDSHIYLDESRTNINKILQLSKEYNDSKFIISPACTINHEPDKSEIMYFIQRLLLKNFFFFYISKFISKTFYKKNKLRFFWTLFSNKKSLNKVIVPNNKRLLNQIPAKQKVLKMWLWINSKKNQRDINLYLKNKKVYGIKFHCYWHNITLQEITEILKKVKIKKIIYIILNYNNLNEINNFINNNKDFKIIFGYGGFPFFKKLFSKIQNKKNCYIDLSSNHIDVDIIKSILKNIKIKQIIYGSDYPYNFRENNEFSYKKNFLRILKLNIKKKLFQDIFYNNLNNLSK